MKKNIYKAFWIALLPLFAMMACKTATVSETSNNSSVNSVENSSNSEPKNALFSSFKNMENVSSWIADVEMNNDSIPQGGNKLQLKFSKPNNMQMEGTLAGNNVKLISLDGKNYMQLGGKWKELPPSANSNQMTDSFKEMSDIKNQEAFKNVQLVGKETVDGKDLMVYTYEFDKKLADSKEKGNEGKDESKSSLADTEQLIPVKIWIDEKNNLPMRINMTIKSPKSDIADNNLDIKYTYDQEFKIEAPKF